MWTVCLGILVLFLAYQSVKAGNARGKIDYKKNLDEVCVTVDGKEFTFRDLAFYVAYEELTIQEQALVYDADNTKKYWNLHINGEFVRVAARESAIQMAIHDQIFYEMAMEEGILLTEEDKQALIEGILDGTIDMIATDHAPHSAEEKSGGLAGSAFGIVGIETAFAAMYTHMVLTGVITLERLVEMLTVNPRKRFGIPQGNSYTVWYLEKEITVDPKEFLSMGKATPFEGWKLTGECVMTVCDGKVVYRK